MIGLLLSLVVLVGSGIWAARAYRRDSWRGAAQAGGYQLRWSWQFLNVRRVAIGVPVATWADFECRRETPGIRRWKRLGLIDELQTGNAGFDRDVFLVGDDPALRALLRTRPALATALHAAVAEAPLFYDFQRLVCRGGTLRAHYRTSSGTADPLVGHMLPALQAVRDALPPAGTGHRDGDRARARAAALVGVATALGANSLLVIVRYFIGDHSVVLDKFAVLMLGLATAVVVVMVLGLLAFALLSGTSRLRVVLPRLLGLGVAGAVFSGLGAVHDANMAFDRSPVRVEESRVELNLTSSTSSRRRGTGGVDYLAMFPQSRTVRGYIEIDGRLYRRLEPKGRVRLRFRDGAFGIPYIESVDPVPPETGAIAR